MMWKSIVVGMLVLETAAVSGAANDMGFHEWALFGGDALYASHKATVPMPHNYQALLEVRLVSAHGDPKAVYLADRAAERARGGNPKYTLSPIVPGHPDHNGHFHLLSVIHDRKPFLANLVRDDRDQPLMTEVTVEVVQVLHQHELGSRPENQTDIFGAPTATLTYLFFGKGRDRILAHLMTAQPDFDQILEVSGGTEAPKVETQALHFHVVSPSSPGGTVPVPDAVPSRAEVGRTVEGIFGESYQAASFKITRELRFRKSIPTDPQD